MTHRSTIGTSAKPVTGRILITGGTGFVGGYIRKVLGDRPTRLLVRNTSAAGARPSANVEIVEGDVTRPETLTGVFEGCEAVIHLVAIISEDQDSTFDGIIRGGTANVVAEAKRAGIDRFIHMSALGAMDDPRYPYLKAKWDSEQIVRDSGLSSTIFRPSVIFGPGDGFISVLANLVKKAPVIPIAGDGASKFQPISATDVASAFERALTDPTTAEQTYELGGADIFTYDELIDTIAARLGKTPRKAHVPVGLVKSVVKLSKPLPAALRPPVTEEQLRMLALDNCSLQSSTSHLIGRQPLRLRDGIDYIVD